MDVHTMLKEVVGNLLLSACEPRLISFSKDHEIHALRVRKAILRASGTQLVRLDSPVNRSPFLLACLDLTEQERVEHLIVGYGMKQGTTTKIQALHHVIGLQDSVTPTPAIRGEIRRTEEQSHKGEVVIFHNHPRSLLNLLIDNLPLASSADRDFAEKLKFALPQVVRTVFGGGEVRLYVGENGFVKEFKWPSFHRLIDILDVILQFKPHDP